MCYHVPVIFGWLTADLESTVTSVPSHGPAESRLCEGLLAEGPHCSARCKSCPFLDTPSNARRMSVHPADRRSARHAATHALCAGASRDLQSGVRLKPGERLRGLGIRRFDAGGYTLRPHTDHHARGGADVNALKDVRPMQFRVIAHRGVSVKRGSRFA